MEERNIRICEHPAVDNILSGYAKIAEQKEILIAWDVTLSKKLPIRDLDLIAILGNAMENAIHGCEKAKAETKQIHVLIRQTKQSVSVRIENTCPQTVFFSEGLPVRKTGGGIGVGSIMASVRKYHGSVQFSADGGSFVVELKLPLDRCAGAQNTERRKE